MAGSIQQAMKAPVLFETYDWIHVPSLVKPGERGHAEYKTLEFEGFRVRMVQYSANYFANHWCKAGHIVYCLEGEFTSELSDGRSFKLSKGMSYVVSDEASMHRSHSENGVKLLIIDGTFLKRTKQKEELNPWRM